MPRLQVQFGWSVSIAALFGLIVTISALGQDPSESQPKSDAKTADKTDMKSEDGTRTKTKGKSEAVTKTDQEWRQVTDREWQRILTKAQYAVTRLKDTEQPFSGKYATSHSPGTYLCVCCKAELFSSLHKFDSGTGWPSFWRPIDVRAIMQAADYSEAEPRMEVMCRRCAAHLGHVFDDGPAPTGLRFCINSLSLDFKGTATANPPAKAKVKVKARAKTTKAKVAPRQTQPKSNDPSPDPDTR
jgi:peptide-methionine (R)-S-oxide reductase